MLVSPHASGYAVPILLPLAPPIQPMTPEKMARLEIDRQLQACGWIVQDRKEMNISAGRGVAVREFALLGGEADYALYVDGKVAGAIEAKPEGHTLAGVEFQSSKYNNGLPAGIPVPWPVTTLIRNQVRPRPRP